MAHRQLPVKTLKPFQLAQKPPLLSGITAPYNWLNQTRYAIDDIDEVAAYSFTTQTFDPKGNPKDRDKD